MIHKQKLKKFLRVLTLMTLALFLCTIPVFATAGVDAGSLDTFNKILKWFMFFLNKIGIVVAVVGLVQFVTSLKSQNPEAKSSGITFLAVGIMIAAIGTDTFCNYVGLY